MARQNANPRTQASARTEASARSNIGIYRVPLDLLSMGVTSLWDWGTGFLGVNLTTSGDRIDSKPMDFRGGSLISAVYTAGEYSVNLEKTTTLDYFVSQSYSQIYTSGMLTVFAWVKIESISNIRSIISQQDASPLRSFTLRLGSNDKLQLLLSPNGATQAIYDSDASITDTTSWHFIACSYDTTNRCRAIVDSTTLVMTLSSGTDPATIFTNSVPFMVGGSVPSAPANLFDGKIGLCGIAPGVSMSPATMQTLKTITQALGRY